MSQMTGTKETPEPDQSDREREDPSIGRKARSNRDGRRRGRAR